MNIKLLAAAAVAASAFTVATPAFATDDCNDMLTVSVGHDLAAAGFDTDALCTLTVSELATIKALLDEDGMTASVQGRIESILAE